MMRVEAQLLLLADVGGWTVVGDEVVATGLVSVEGLLWAWVGIGGC